MDFMSSLLFYKPLISSYGVILSVAKNLIIKHNEPFSPVLRFAQNDTIAWDCERLQRKILRLPNIAASPLVQM